MTRISPPRTRDSRIREPRTNHPARAVRVDDVHAELRAAIAAAHHLDPDRLAAGADTPVVVDARFDLLGAAPVRTGTDALARLDDLAGALVGRMQAAGWSAGAAPGAVTSVLAASVPAAEAVLLAHARPPSTRAGGR